MIQYGKDFMAQLVPVTAPGRENGGMITSCICHGCPWSDLLLEGKSTEEHYFDWFTGRTTGGAGSMHVDSRLPNGGGALTGPKFAMCRQFP